MNLIQSPKPTAFTAMNYCICRQNGGLETWTDGSGDSSPEIAIGSTICSHNGNVVPNDNSKRPKSLEVTSTNGYATKASREDSDVDDGSLPCTPEIQSDGETDVPSCPAGDEVLEDDTRQLISQSMKSFTGRSIPRWTEHRALQTMKRVVDGVLEKHRYAYNGMINKLSLDNTGDDVRFVGAVAKSLFADGTTNWGRIASLVAFGAVVCQRMKETGRENCVESVGQEISKYLLSDQRDWLVKNNSWDGFVAFFRVADPESKVRNTLMAFAGFAGIGATLALLISAMM
uniref:MCL1 apoptosis regulator, BCL2 family member b n=1 Tax=Seriola dumerili TaxID=41447 RepID=A0A3B4T8L9_SERDU